MGEGASNESTPAGDHSEDIDIFPAVDPEGPVDDEPESDLTPVTPVLGRSDPIPDDAKQITRIEMPNRTILKVVGTIFVIWLVLQVHQILLLVFVSFLLALALVPPVRYLDNRGLPRPIAVAVTFVVLIGFIVGYIGLIVPPMVTQAQNVVDNFPAYTANLERVIARYPSLNERNQEIKANGFGENAQMPLTDVISLGTQVLTRVANTFFVLVLSFYLLLEGEHSYRFLARYCTPRLRYRL
jgi:predicted PurR-regulated permease PerM